MTLDEIVRRVRELVNDAEVNGARFSGETIHRFAVQAVRQLRRICPTERYGESGQIEDDLPSTDNLLATMDLRFSERHEEAVIMYIAYLLYRLDDSDTVNASLAETYRQRAEALMQL